MTTSANAEPTHILLRQIAREIQLSGTVKGARVRGYSSLIPLDDAGGAVLFWAFDESECGVRSVALVRLTEEEAEKVYKADAYTIGMLEPVRTCLTHRSVLAGSWHIDGTMQLVPTVISGTGTERQFLAELDHAVAVAVDRPR